VTTPLTLTATAAELDQDSERQVLSFGRSYQRSAANIREIEEAPNHHRRPRREGSVARWKAVFLISR